MKKFYIDFKSTFIVEAETKEKAEEKFWENLPYECEWTEIDYVEEEN